MRADVMASNCNKSPTPWKGGIHGLDPPDLQPRQEGEDLGDQLVDRGQHLREAEELQCGHDAD